MQQSDAAQLLARIGKIFYLRARRSERVVDAAVEYGVKDFFFAFEVEINGAVGDAGFTRDVGDFRIEVTVVRKHANGRARDRLALIAACGFRVAVQCSSGTHNRLPLNDASLIHRSSSCST